MITSAEHDGPTLNLPYILGTKCIWALPLEFTENNGLASLGRLQTILLCQSALNFDPPSASNFDPPQVVVFSC